MSTQEKPPALNLRQLYYFLTLADHGSISAAADSLGMAQPSLSENIAKLERSLGVKLAIRGARGVELTEAGVALTARGKQILQMSESMVEGVQSIGTSTTGQVTVALPPSVGLVLSVPLAETVQTEMPSIRMHLTEAMSRIILEKIDREDVHIGCVYETPDPSQFVTQPLYTEELFLCTAPDNWPGEIGSNGVALQPVPVDVLEKLPLVMPNNSHGGRTVAEKYARSFNTSLNVVMEIDPLPSLIEMACRASAYTILSEAAVMHHVNAGTLALVPIEGVKMERTAYLVRKRSRPMSRAAFWVQNMIISITEEMIQRYKLSARLHPARENSETA